MIGINTAIYSSSGGSNGIGFAIPVDSVVSSVADLLKFGKVVRPILGIALAPEQAGDSQRPESRARRATSLAALSSATSSAASTERSCAAPTTCIELWKRPR